MALVFTFTGGVLLPSLPSPLSQEAYHEVHQDNYGDYEHDADSNGGKEPCLHCLALVIAGASVVWLLSGER